MTRCNDLLIELCPRCKNPWRTHLRDSEDVAHCVDGEKYDAVEIYRGSECRRRNNGGACLCCDRHATKTAELRAEIDRLRGDSGDKDDRGRSDKCCHCGKLQSEYGRGLRTMGGVAICAACVYDLREIAEMSGLSEFDHWRASE